MRRLLCWTVGFLALACVPNVQIGGAGLPGAAITTGDQLVTAMQRRYNGRWYRTMTFVQKTTYFRIDGSFLRTETWYEAAALPGRLRIDIGEPSRATGVLYRRDSTYQIQGGRLTDRRRGGNLLLVLGFDVFTQPSWRTLEQLRAEGINLSLLRTDSLEGRRMYVVGAARGDSVTDQFWIDAERLLFVRAIQTDRSGRISDPVARTRDIRFERYVPYNGGWVAEDVKVIVGGKVTIHEEYSNVRVNVPLDDDLFVPERWSAATHWYRP